MKEVEIIKGEKINIKLITFIIVVVGIIALTIVYSILSEGWKFPLDNYSIICPFGMIMIPCLIIVFEFYLCNSKTDIVVTNKRVYGVASFGRRVDLPLDKISAVGTSYFKGIYVMTSSGTIHFRLFKNNVEIHSKINDLLIERQDKKEPENNNVNSNNSTIEELKQWKELLDNGTITQEDFDKKKKELLK